MNRRRLFVFGGILTGCLTACLPALPSVHAFSGGVGFLADIAMAAQDSPEMQVTIDPRAWALVFPGLGLLAQGEEAARGTLWLAAGALSAGAAVYAGLQGEAAYDEYRAAQTSADAKKYRRRTERWDSARNWSAGGFIAIWLLSIGDTYRRPPAKTGLIASPDVGLSWSAEIGVPALTLRIWLP